MVLRNSNTTELQRTLVLTAMGGSLECSAICKALKTLCRLPTMVDAAHFNQNNDGDGHSEPTFLGKGKGRNDTKTGKGNGGRGTPGKAKAEDICYGCTQKGHFIKDCRNLKQKVLLAGEET